MDPTLRISTDADRILTIVMDAPGKSVNTCSAQFLSDLANAIETIERESPAAVIIASAKARSFNAGADLYDIRGMQPEQVKEFVALGQRLFDRIAHLKMPTVAAINGDCMGGGYELALACKYRVAADEGSISIGLPEVKIGLIPGWGGTTRLPRTIGLTHALPILLGGKTMPPKKAQRAGLVDEVVRPLALPAAAKRIAMTHPKKRKPAMIDRGIASIGPIRKRALESAKKKALAATHGNYPAPMKVIDIVQAGYERGMSAGLEAERDAIVELAMGDVGRNLMRLFFLRQGAKKRAASLAPAMPRDIKYAAVIGGGTMGAGIVHALIRAGLPVRLVEIDAKAVSAALGRIAKMLADDVSMGKVDRLAARHAMNRVSPTLDWTGLELADFVVEAVLETIEAKREVFAKLDQVCRPNTILATNTSSLRIADIAQPTLHPQRVIGLHFFNPVPKMPLVEIVRGAQSDDVSLATAIALTGKIGKTPVLVNDAPGFVVNRILVPYLGEAMRMASEGISITAIDEALKKWGMPMGPFELLDEVGLDIANHVIKSLASATPMPATVGATFEKASANKWLGKKTGRGFYLHAQKKKGEPELPLNDELISVLAPKRIPTPEPEAIQQRLVDGMVNEANRVLEERVANSGDDVDLATVLGLGLAPFRGGIIHYANSRSQEKVLHHGDTETQREEKSEIRMTIAE